MKIVTVEPGSAGDRSSRVDIPLRIERQHCTAYQMPAYKLHGGLVLYFAGWRQHYAIYLATAHAVAAFKDDLASYEISKGTIRFPLSEPVPVKLIERIAKFRARKVAERMKAKAAARKKR